MLMAQLKAGLLWKCTWIDAFFFFLIIPNMFHYSSEPLIYSVWLCGVTGGGRCHAQMECRWET